MLIFDALGNEKTPEWLACKYGAVELLSPPAGRPCWRVFALCEDADYETQDEPAQLLPDWWPEPLATAAIVVKALGEAGDPQPGIPVARFWPDAPDLPVERRHWKRRGVIGWTNVDGDTGFGMGDGDFYTPPAQTGATWVWIAQPDVNTEAVAGLGMLAGTNHHHMNVVFRWDSGQQPPPPGDNVTTLLTEIRDLCRQILTALLDDPA